MKKTQIFLLSLSFFLLSSAMEEKPGSKKPKKISFAIEPKKKILTKEERFSREMLALNAKQAQRKIKECTKYAKRAVKQAQKTKDRTTKTEKLDSAEDFYCQTALIYLTIFASDMQNMDAFDKAQNIMEKDVYSIGVKRQEYNISFYVHPNLEFTWKKFREAEDNLRIQQKRKIC